MKSRGRIVVFSAPSGAGKSSLIQRAMAAIPLLRYSVSATTRQPRPGEVDGVHYFFKSREEFEAMIAGGELAEWNEVHGNLYGTPKAFLDEAVARGERVVMDLDVEGKANFDSLYPGDHLGIFITVPSLAELERRLRGRGTESEDVLRVRLENARREIEAGAKGFFQHRIVNDDLDRATAELLDILRRELWLD